VEEMLPLVQVTPSLARMGSEYILQLTMVSRLFLLYFKTEAQRDEWYQVRTGGYVFLSTLLTYFLSMSYSSPCFARFAEIDRIAGCCAGQGGGSERGNAEVGPTETPHGGYGNQFILSCNVVDLGTHKAKLDANRSPPPVERERSRTRSNSN
jgi:hypothetical protein